MPSDQGEVYFAEAIGAGAVKIGFTWKGTRNRIQSMQSHNHCELRLVCVIAAEPETESQLHQQFAHLWIRGEWFRFGDEIKAFISDHPAPTILLPKEVPVRCYKCRWGGWRSLITEECPKCGHWYPLPLPGPTTEARR